MARIFNRKYELSFGPRDGDLTTIRELRVKFNIEKSNKKESNTATIEVYNLSEKSRNVFQQKDVVVQLQAGYEGRIQGCFIGDVTKVEHRRQGADRVTLIDCGDGQKAINEATISKSYAKGTSVKNVLMDLIGSFANTTFSQKLDAVVSPLAQLTSGGSFEGASENILTELLSSFGLSFSIQDGEITVEGNALLNDTDIKIVSASTGLIQSPSKTDTGVAFIMLLEARIRPGSILQLQSESVSGLYKATKVVHEGDNFDRPWYTKVEAEPL